MFEKINKKKKNKYHNKEWVNGWLGDKEKDLQINGASEKKKNPESHDSAEKPLNSL